LERVVSRALILTCALLGCVPQSARAVAWPPANEALLHSSRFWEAHQRGDLALLALQKLVAARPDSPDALLELGELDLRINDFAAAAQVQSELTRRFKGSAAARDFATEYRVATRDRLQLVSIRREVDIDHTQGVREALARLFPDGAPGGAIGIDYYLLLGGVPRYFSLAYQGLKRLAAQHPDDPRYQLALARLMLRQDGTRLAGVRLLQRLQARDDAPAEDVDHWLASGLLRLGIDHAPAELVRTYLARHPDEIAMQTLRDRQQEAIEERGLLSADKLAALLPKLQHRLSQELSSPAHNTQARAQAGFWLERSRSSLAAGRERLAAIELRAALAFARALDESQIGVAQDLELQGASQEAGELLAAAARLDPSSTWLFETRVRWLIAHAGSTEAIELIRARALDRKWRAPARDALLASALNQRAAEETEAGHPEAAIADLEAATKLAPRDPWMRYRLAEQYRIGGAPDRGRSVMSEGSRMAPNEPNMRYAQALYLSSLEDYATAYAAVDGIDPSRRTAGMISLHDRLRVALARATARRLKGAGDLAGARAALLEVEPIAAASLDRAADLAYAWIELGDPEHGIALVEPYIRGSGTPDPAVLLTWAQVLNSADDTARLAPALATLQGVHGLTPESQAEVKRLQRALDLRLIRALERERKFAEAGRRLDALLARDPGDRELRVARADLYLSVGESRAARDRYAALAAEDPDDWDTRLSYIRALTECGDLALAREQLKAVEDKMPNSDVELEINLARRQLALGDSAKALRTLQPLLAMSPTRPDVLMLAARAELAQRHFALAGAYFDRAAALATGPDASAALRESAAIALRLESSVTAGLIVRHQPGAAGMSEIDALTIPSAWILATGYESRLTARADAVFLDAGRWSNSAALPFLGTIPTAAAGAVRYTNDTQIGLSPGVGYQTDSLSVDLGSTPLGFLLPNIVGGVEWTPTWHSADITLGLARRAVTSSELSYAGLRDPISGTPWGGVVQTGPYAGVGIYRENYDVSAAVQASELTGTRVLDNQFLGARASTSWKFWSRADARADAGVTLTYWSFQHNLSNYTFGDGGYYSPQSYVSLATPIELDGDHAGWFYKLRASPSFTVSQIHESAFYPDDPALQAAAQRSATLPDGYSSPYYSGYHSTGFGVAAYAAAERKVTAGLVVGFMFDIDRTDYYHPSTVEIYFRHAFAPWATHTVSPPRPVRPYSP
jgi:predicted Zn-dependent protease